jgi:hypothetical protein
MVVLSSGGLYRTGTYAAGFESAFRSDAEADSAEKLPDAGAHNSGRKPDNMNLNHMAC